MSSYVKKRKNEGGASQTAIQSLRSEVEDHLDSYHMQHGDDVGLGDVEITGNCEIDGNLTVDGTINNEYLSDKQNKVTGVSDTEIGYLDGVTSAIQTQLDTLSTGKQDVVTGVDDTEIGYLNGVTSAIQTQLDGKQDVVSGVSDAEIGYLDGVTSAIQTQLDGKQDVVTGVDDTEIGYLNGVTSSIQSQLDSKITAGGTTSYSTGDTVIENTSGITEFIVKGTDTSTSASARLYLQTGNMSSIGWRLHLNNDVSNPTAYMINMEQGDTVIRNKHVTTNTNLDWTFGSDGVLSTPGDVEITGDLEVTGETTLNSNLDMSGNDITYINDITTGAGMSSTELVLGQTGTSGLNHTVSVSTVDYNPGVEITMQSDGDATIENDNGDLTVSANQAMLSEAGGDITVDAGGTLHLKGSSSVKLYTSDTERVSVSSSGLISSGSNFDLSGEMDLYNGNLRLPGGIPSSPVGCNMYFNSSDKSLRVYSGGWYKVTLTAV